MHTSLGFEANASLNQVVAIGCRVQQNYFIIILADIRPGQWPLLRH